MSTAVDVLNRGFAADPAAMHAILCNRVPCNQSLADDPTIVVESNCVGVPGANGGALGLINGILAELGLPLVAARFTDKPVDDRGRRAWLGFCDYVSPTPLPQETQNES